MRRYTLDIRGREYSIDVQELAADRFEVIVGDQTYEVTLAADEELGEESIAPGIATAHAAGSGTGAGASPAATVVARTRGATAAPLPRRAGGGGSATLNAPMPGVIIEVAVKPGDTVVRGQEIALLDAMKMHNSIKSPRAGTVHEVCVTPGQAVGHGDPIIRYEEG
jgi:biotin carboxyl carrier protein